MERRHWTQEYLQVRILDVLTAQPWKEAADLQEDKINSVSAPSGISRVSRSKKQAMAAYDWLSRWYDWFATSSEQPLADLGLKELNASAGDTILEIGCGTGRALLALASAVGDSGRVVGMDLSRGMLNIARGRISCANVSPGVLLAQGDASVLPFPSDFFDAVFVAFTLELFDTPEIPVVLSECRRTLKTGGRMGVVAMTREERENIPQRIYEWFHQRMPAYVDCRPIYVQAALKQAGFQIRSATRRRMWGLPVAICLVQKTTQG